MSKYKEGKPVYFVRNMLYAGVKRKAGEQVDEKFLENKHHVAQMFRVRLFGHDDTRMATATGKPVEAEAPVEQDSVEQNEDVAKVVVDNDDDFQVVYKGVQFEINRNQIREDGTLTAGGMKAYKAAIAE